MVLIGIGTVTVVAMLAGVRVTSRLNKWLIVAFYTVFVAFQGVMAFA